jgi:hypothetical protein
MIDHHRFLRSSFSSLSWMNFCFSNSS